MIVRRKPRAPWVRLANPVAPVDLSRGGWVVVESTTFEPSSNHQATGP